MRYSDVYLAVEAVLAPEERSDVLRAVVRTNPHLQGCEVADWLADADNYDVYLAQREQIWDQLTPALVAEVGRDWLRVAAIARITQHGGAVPAVEEVVGLARAARARQAVEERIGGGAQDA